MVALLTVPRVIERDADDEHVIACALAGQADLIVSGDKHLHSLGEHYQVIAIAFAVRAFPFQLSGNLKICQLKQILIIF